MGCSRFFPMAVGRSWLYRLTFGGHDQGRVRQSVLAARHNPASSFWKMERRITGAEPEQYAVVSSDAEVRIASAVVLRAPLEEGAEWGDSSEEGILRYTVVHTNLEMQVPAGRYVGCLEVAATRGGAEVQRTVYAPEVGMVSHRTALPGGWLELELEELQAPGFA